MGRRRGRIVCIAVAGSLGLVAAGCSSSSGESLCRRSHGAEVCLHGDGSAYELEGTGFPPRTELAIVVDGNPVTVIAVDDNGSTSNASVAGVLAGPVEQHVTVSAASVSGTATVFEFVVPAVTR